jgi:hypothetical protein
MVGRSRAWERLSQAEEHEFAKRRSSRATAAMPDAESAAASFTIIASCRLHELDPEQLSRQPRRTPAEPRHFCRREIGSEHRLRQVLATPPVQPSDGPYDQNTERPVAVWDHCREPRRMRCRVSVLHTGPQAGRPFPCNRRENQICLTRGRSALV